MRRIDRKPLELELQNELDAFQEKLTSDASVATDVVWKMFSKRKGALLRHLLEMYSDKCCYCEIILDSQSYPPIEHFKPKSRFRDSCFDYTNLHVCCVRCNTNKGDRFSDSLISPTEDQPDEHLVFVADIEISGRTQRGLDTIQDFLRLNGDDLKKTRSAYLKQVNERLEDVRNYFTLLPGSRSLIKEKLQVLRELTEPSSPFSLMIRDLFADSIFLLESRLAAIPDDTRK